MNSSADKRLMGIGYYEGFRTPEGKILVRYRAPDFAPVQFNTDELDWGELNIGSLCLATLLIRDVGSSHWPWPKMEEKFAEMVIAKLPRERKWRLWCSEIGHFREKIHREQLVGRSWPECDYEQ